MEPRKQNVSNSITSSPLANPSSSSSFLKDISNIKTPKSSCQNPNSRGYPSPYPPSRSFTASKAIPTANPASARRSLINSKASAAKSRIARRLRAFEFEQSKSARKAQISKEKSLKSLARSLTVWLNFLFENPRSCGCEVSKFTGECEQDDGSEVTANGKRESGPGQGIGVHGPWRGPKRPRNCSWKVKDDAQRIGASDSTFSGLKDSLRDICSFDDLKNRMRAYLSLESCKEVFETMIQLTKNIDDGRLRMRAHCPIVTDVGMKEKAVQTLLSYNPIWLRIGLHLILGGDSLLLDEDVDSAQDIAFLKMIIEKQFFSHAASAKTYSYNKLVDGLYRPGYYEKLGIIILKRFLLLVLTLDRIKSQSSLPLEYGIDGRDGGSPLLFGLQSKIKSSCQMISGFLSSEVMHGEGNLLAHLTIVGYKVFYQQSPVLEYEFGVTDLFRDLQDGIRLCRAIQLLQHDSSILKKMVVPADTPKKSLANCTVALNYMKEAGVPLVDEDGMVIMADDVANGEKELILSLLWNMFVHLQVPLLANRTLLSEEIFRITGVAVQYSNTSLLDMLLRWIQAVCENYEFKVEDLSSLVDGKAFWCLLEYYFRKDCECSCSFKDSGERNEKVSLVSRSEYTDAVHNFILSQKLTSLLGNFPEVLQISDILENHGASNDRSVVILLVFLSFQLVVKRNVEQLNFHKLLGCSCKAVERKRSIAERYTMRSEAVGNGEQMICHDAARNFKTIMAWWQEMAIRNHRFSLNLGRTSPQPAVRPAHCFNTRMDCKNGRENAAKVIQSHFRRMVERGKYLRLRKTVFMLQSISRAWLIVKKIHDGTVISKKALDSLNAEKHSDDLVRYVKLLIDRHNFVKLKKSVLVLQRRTRVWISQRHQNEKLLVYGSSTSPDVNDSAILPQNCTAGWIEWDAFCYKPYLVSSEEDSKCTHVSLTIKRAWRNHKCTRFLQQQHFAATRIQSYFRGWLMRKCFKDQREATIKIQSIFRCIRILSNIQRLKLEMTSAAVIQSHVRGWMVRRVYSRHKHLCVLIQSRARGWLKRREFHCQKDAVIRIQRTSRYMKHRKAYLLLRHAAIVIQGYVRGETIRNRHLDSSCNRGSLNDGLRTSELSLLQDSVAKLQRWWRRLLLLRRKTKSAIVIQSHIRGWISRRIATRERQRVVVIQSYWKGYLARKSSKTEISDLRLRVQKSAANVDSSMRLINRLVAALSELLSMRSLSGILHTCATLDMATKHSQRCCEELVNAGAVDTLLKLIQSISRSIPDQEVLKHALSTLRNLTRYPHLTEVLIGTHGSVETVLRELLRNNNEGYFIAIELLKKICAYQKGCEAVYRSLPLLKRLLNHVEELSRKAKNEKRIQTRELIERRLKEAAELLELIRM